MKCRICGNAEDNRSHVAREMMFGQGGAFPYFQCSVCECLQIAEYPTDIHRYYGANYYSYASRGRESIVDRLKTRLRDRHEVFGGGLIGRYLSARDGNPLLRGLASVLDDRSKRVLEVGCGSGALLRSLHAIGFRHLTGADPFIDADIAIDDRFVIHKKRMADLPGPFDVIMFHHSLEHLQDQHAIFRQIADRLAPGGRCVVRVPLSSSFAWQEYSTDWVQLDAPRHFYLHSVESLRRLATAAGMAISAITHDSTSFQFWGSEQYRRNIPLRDPRSLAQCKVEESIFTRSQMAEFQRRSAELNASGRGDQAAFVIDAPT